ncbi:Rpr2-domain-containing protein [Tilletiaria anomala UBC 951]|uniref:Rpr2-domain-containing protein n=1 Tax=Tilletiaria anomala (strain ATCC 24038 / CBS 436.72 / UBC 951) TaxID=1037660 RepID=A0A066VQ64_TILAU|nr:Rpr2-domain-containing protein [Tilletiaria anomala UBC 951]KDN42393.1 Rpr2-domain-containing protein [Tilletiaria anomala UBC 951]
MGRKRKYGEQAVDGAAVTGGAGGGRQAEAAAVGTELDDDDNWNDRQQPTHVALAPGSGMIQEGGGSAPTSLERTQTLSALASDQRKESRRKGHDRGTPGRQREASDAKGGKGKGKAKANQNMENTKALQEPPIPKTAPNFDAFSTLNNMLQSAMVLTLQAFMYRANPTAPKKVEHKDSHGENAAQSKTHKYDATSDHLAELARRRVGEMKALARKAVISLDPSIKRSICKRCDTLLLPGITDEVRVNESKAHGSVVQHTCAHCGFKRRLPAPPAGTVMDGATSSCSQNRRSDDANGCAFEFDRGETADEGTEGPQAQAENQEIPEMGMETDVGSVQPTSGTSVHVAGAHAHIKPTQTEGLPVFGLGAAATAPTAHHTEGRTSKNRIPQRQRRKAGNLADLVSRRIQQEASLLRVADVPHGTHSSSATGTTSDEGGKKGKRTSNSKVMACDSLLQASLQPTGPLPETLERGIQRARRALFPPGKSREQQEPAASRSHRKSNDTLLLKIYGQPGRAPGPTNNEKRKIAALERRRRIACGSPGNTNNTATMKQTAKAPHNETEHNTRSSRLSLGLPPFHERIKGSGWANRVPDHVLGGADGNSSEIQRLGREEVAARKLHGGHVMITGREPA